MNKTSVYKFAFVVFTLLLTGCETVRLFSALYDDNFGRGDYYVSSGVLSATTDPVVAYQKPIAREVKVSYLVTGRYKDTELEPNFYTEEKKVTDESGKTTIPSLSLYTKPLGTNNSLGNQLSREAEKASKKGDHKYAADLHRMSIASDQIDQSIAKQQEAAGLLSASLNVAVALLESAVKNAHKQDMKLITDYIKNDLQAVGKGATKGSVLHIFLEQDTDLAEIKPIQFKHLDHILLTLELSNGTILRSANKSVWFLYKGTPEGKWKLPTDFVKIGLKKEDTEETLTATEKSFRYVALTAAVKDLYLQLEMKALLKK